MALDSETRSGPGATGMAVAALACFAAASLAVFGNGPREAAPTPGSAIGKLADRLSFVEEDIPVRQTRVYDTLAMFALPQAQGAPWGDARIAVPADAPRRPDALPRMVEAEAAPARRLAILPPIRPAEILRAEASLRTEHAAPIRAGAIPMATTGSIAIPQPGERSVEWVASAEPTARQVEILGVAVPGSQHLPTRRETMRGVTALGQKAKDLGTGTVATVGGALSTATDTIVDVFSFR